MIVDEEEKCLRWLLLPGYIQSLLDSCTAKEGSLFSPTSRRNELFPLETVDLPLSLWLLNMETVAKSINFYEERCGFQIETGEKYATLQPPSHNLDAPKDSCWNSLNGLRYVGRKRRSSCVAQKVYG